MNISRPAILNLPAPPSKQEDLVAWTRSLQEALTANLNQTNNLLSGGLRLENHQWKRLSVVNQGNGAFTLTHNLGKLPELFLYSIIERGVGTMVAGTLLYSTAAQWTARTTSTLALTLIGAGAACDLEILVI